METNAIETAALQRVIDDIKVGEPLPGDDLSRVYSGCGMGEMVAF